MLFQKRFPPFPGLFPFPDFLELGERNEKNKRESKNPAFPVSDLARAERTAPNQSRNVAFEQWGSWPDPWVIAAARNRSFSTDLPAAQTADATFMESWNKVLPTWILRRLHSLSCSLDPLPLPPSPPSSLSISFSLVLLSWPPKQRVPLYWDLMINFREIAGEKTVSANNSDFKVVVLLCTLKMEVDERNETTKYFVSSGFVFIHANSFADIIAVEAVPLDQIDANLVQKGLAKLSHN
ncbi:hypothetical protein V6N13_068569 [Hibiscus sabdariffa]